MIKYIFPVFLLQFSLLAQTGTLTGQVTDESGAVVPKATVTIAGSRGVAKTTTSGDNGSYSLGGLTPGDYALQASAPDLVMAQAVKITVKAGAQVLNLQLKV